jgi:hypothetical protein
MHVNQEGRAVMVHRTSSHGALFWKGITAGLALEAEGI